jgi:hypothetical protein
MNMWTSEKRTGETEWAWVKEEVTAQKKVQVDG